MTTVAEFITYLQTLPPETVVKVAENVECGYSSYVTFNDLQLPTESFQTCSDNLEFFTWEWDNTTELQLGSR